MSQLVSRAHRGNIRILLLAAIDKINQIHLPEKIFYHLVKREVTTTVISNQLIYSTIISPNIKSIPLQYPHSPGGSAIMQQRDREAQEGREDSVALVTRDTNVLLESAYLTLTLFALNLIL